MIKVVVFDFDDTLYNTDVWYKWAEFCDSAIRKCLVGYSEEQVRDFIDKYNLINACNGNAIAEALIRETGKDEAWVKLRDDLYAEAKGVKFAKNEIIKEFSENFTLYIVSFSPESFIQYYSTKYGFDLSNFKKILGNDQSQCENNKKIVFEQIIKDSKIKPEEMCVIGDNFSRDILPARELNCNAIQITKISEINKKLLEKVKNM